MRTYISCNNYNEYELNFWRLMRSVFSFLIYLQKFRYKKVIIRMWSHERRLAIGLLESNQRTTKIIVEKMNGIQE